MFESLAFAMGPAPAAGGSASGGDMLVQFVPLILMFAIFWFLLIRPQQKRAKEHKAMLENLKRGDYVITSAGLKGRVAELDDATIMLECGEAKLCLTRNSIAMLDNPKPKGAEAVADNAKPKGNEEEKNN